jgi:hypothetical protein
MQVEVECHAGYRGEEEPRRLLLGERTIELTVVDRWLSPEHRYFKARGADGSTYILRHDGDRGWELTTYDATGELK